MVFWVFDRSVDISLLYGMNVYKLLLWLDNIKKIILLREEMFSFIINLVVSRCHCVWQCSMYETIMDIKQSNLQIVKIPLTLN